MGPFPLGRPARLAVFASGRGTNLEALLEAFPQGHPLGEVVLVVSDNPEAFALERAKRRGVEAQVLPWRGRRAFEEGALALLAERGVDAVLLAGFMRLLSPRFVVPWYGRLLNLHPSLLPDYPGLRVHERVLAAGERETGSTVHFVDQGMDTGPILLQGRVPVLPGDTPRPGSSAWSTASTPRRSASSSWASPSPRLPTWRRGSGRRRPGPSGPSPRGKSPSTSGPGPFLRPGGGRTWWAPPSWGGRGFGDGPPSSPPTSSVGPTRPSWRRWRSFPPRSGPRWRGPCG